MFQRLRKFLTSIPSITVVGLLSAYLLIGFFVLPAVLRWQLEKQLADRGHALRVGDLRFDPLRLRLEVERLSLSDASGAPMFGFDNLMVDLEWRSITDGSWTIADSRLVKPTLRFVRARDGSHNFSALLAQFASDPQQEPDKDQGVALPPVRVERLLLVNGQAEWLDQMLEQPLVSRITPLQVELHGVSTTGAQMGRYRISARTEAGESLELHGEIGIEARHASGELALRDLQVATLARGLNREIALQSPRGSIDMSGDFDLSLRANGMWAGGARALQLVLTDLLLQPPGASAPLLAAQDLGLHGGRLDLARRELHFETLRIADGSANAAIDAQGSSSWNRVLRNAGAGQDAEVAREAAAAEPTQASTTASATPLSAPAATNPDTAASGTGRVAAGAGTALAAPAATADTPWSVSIGDLRIDRLALALRDGAQQRSVTVTELGLATALHAQVGGAIQADIRLPQLRLTVNGLALAQGDAGVDVPLTQVDAGAIALQARGAQFDATLDTVKLTLAQGVSAHSGTRFASAGVSTLATSGIRTRSSGAGARLELDAPHWQARSLQARADGQSARVGQVDIAGGKLVLDAGSGASGNSSMTLALEAPKLQFDTIAAESGIGTIPSAGTSADTSADAGTGTSMARTAAGAANTPMDAVPAAGPNAQAGATPDPQAGQSVHLAQLTVQAQRLSMELAGGDNSVLLDALQSQSQLQDLRLQVDGQELTMANLALDNGRLTIRQGAAGAQLQVETPVLRMDGIAARRDAQRADLAELKLQGARIDVSTGSAGATELVFSGMQGSGSQLALARDADTLQLASLALGSELLTLVRGTDTAQFSGSGISAALTEVQAVQAGNRLTLQQALWQARAFDGSSALAAGSPRASAHIDGSELTLAALGLRRGAAATETATASSAGANDLATLASVTWSAGDLSLEVTDGPLQLRGSAMALQLDQALLHDPTMRDTQLVQLGDIALSGGAFSLAERSVSADALRVRGARASVWLDDQGRVNLLELLDAPEPAPSSLAGTASPWRVVVKTVDLQDASVRFEDRRRDPPLALGLDAVTLNLSGVDTAVGAPPMQVVLGATLTSGGQVQAKGSAALDPQAVDLQLAVTGLALAPVQPVLSDYLDLTLASGNASTQGRLTYGAVAGVPSRLSYTGGFAVDNFLLEEIKPKRPFLAWESVRADDLKLTLEPNKVDIGEILLDRPVGRLIIAEDQSINITDVLKKPDLPVPEPVGAAAADEEPAADTFPVTVARVKVNDGQLEFADLSLRPQFGTRMHELKGVITGVGTDANRSAQVQLDARVDKFGSARIRGQASLLQPERLTEIEMVFRNLDMTALSPYVVKFAGYEIASGRLSLDLQYTVRDGKLLGENKVVLNKVELGKKVESPDALDLPLELALAILKDSKGVIDIGLPVRGDLNDPQFDYGAVIGKAIGNLLGSIVTAPFRALAAIFGGGGDKSIDTIDFEPGMATLAPPEQQKVQTVARALKERPKLVLKVAPVMAPEQDTPVLQSLVVRREIARRMGLELAPHEDPGPIDASNPRVPAAVEAAFGARYAPAVFDALRQRALETSTPVAADVASDVAAGKPTTSPAAPAATPTAPAAAGAQASAATASGASAAARPAAAPKPPAEFYQGLIRRMIAEQPVTEAMLAQLGNRRADAIVQAVTGEEGGVPPERVLTGELRKTPDASASVVPLKLELEVAK